MKIEVNQKNFQQEVIESEIPVLVDFWAEWCMPCKMLDPTVEEIAGEYAGRLKVCGLNIDNAQGLASKYSVMSIPTLALFKGGEIVEKTVGALPKEAIVEKFSAYLS